MPFELIGSGFRGNCFFSKNVSFGTASSTPPPEQWSSGGGGCNSRGADTIGFCCHLGKREMRSFAFFLPKRMRDKESFAKVLMEGWFQK